MQSSRDAMQHDQMVRQSGLDNTRHVVVHERFAGVDLSSVS
jgi:hypothetical protein